MKQNARRATSPSLIFILDLLPFAQRALGNQFILPLSRVRGRERIGQSEFGLKKHKTNCGEKKEKGPPDH
jgi:hypothetical protein